MHPPATLVSAAALPADKGVRLDQFLARHAGEGVSRARVQEWIRAGLATVDGAACLSPSHRLKGDEAVELRGPCDRADGCLTPESGELAVMHRDAALIVLDKPAGLTTHPAPSCPQSTLVHRLLHHFPELAAMAAHDRWRPGIVHRLDKDTSGLMLAALTEAARLALTRDFAARRVGKAYLALVHGVPKDKFGELRLPIGRHPTIKTRMAVVDAAKGGRPALSCWEALWTAEGGSMALLRVAIHTGRTHQIRVHLAALGHPIVGDAVYGPGPFAGWEKPRPHLARLARRQMLHAHELRFSHPQSGERLDFRSMPPKDFRRLPLIVPRRVQRVGITGLPGSGKSLLLKLLAQAGAPTFCADAAVAELYAPGGDGAHLLARRYGDRFAAPGGGVDKRALFAAMLADERLRREVEGLIHPLVRCRLEAFFGEHAAARLAVAEIPLLLEAGFDRGNPVDVVVGVTLSAYDRKMWLSTRRNLTQAQAEALESWQWPEDRKLARCDLIVANPGTPEGLAAEAQALRGALRAARVAAVLRLRDRLEPLWAGDRPVDILR